MKQTERGMGIAILAAAVACAGWAAAGTHTWTGAVSADWTNVANWSGGLPDAGGHVVIPAGMPFAPTIPAGTNPVSGAYASLAVSNGVTVTCLGDPTAVNEPSGGTVAVPHGIGATIFCDEARIVGTLSAKGKGFPAYAGPGYSYEGASHGSKGAAGVATYGSAASPSALGSGSGPGDLRSGGGAIRIAAAGDLILDGVIDVSVNDEARSGAGGSIWLSAARLAGGGHINARGGDGLYPGGGGRVAVSCETNDFTGTIDVGGGWDTDASIRAGLYPRCVPGTLVFPNYLPTGSPAAPADVVLGGGVALALPDSVTNYWNLTVTSGYATILEGSLVISNLTLATGTRCALAFDSLNSAVAWGNRTLTAMEPLDIHGAIRLEGQSFLFLPALRYDLSGDLTIGANSTLTAVSDLTAVNEESGGTALKPHGRGPSIRCANADIAGTLTAAGMGFLSGTGPGYFGNAYSHGGQAGGASLAYTYGKVSRPASLGGNRHESRLGGGAVRLTAAGVLSIDGEVSANATTNVAAWACSGGSIWLTAETVRGAGVIHAVGTDVTHTGEYHGGGGGRVALFFRENDFTGRISVQGGTAVGGQPGYPGTVFQSQSPVPDSGASDSPGVWLQSEYAVNANGTVISRTVSRWRRSFEWTEDSRDQNGNPLANVADYVLSGVPPTSGYAVYTNGVLAQSRIESDAFGTLAVCGVALAPSATVRVEAMPAGTVLQVR